MYKKVPDSGCLGVTRNGQKQSITRVVFRQYFPFGSKVAKTVQQEQ